MHPCASWWNAKDWTEKHHFPTTIASSLKSLAETGIKKVLVCASHDRPCLA